MSCRHRHDRGAAMLTAVMMLLLAGLTAVSFAQLGRLAALRARTMRDGARAWFLAEAGLADTVVATPPGTVFTGLLATGTRRVDAGDGFGWAATALDDHDEMPDDPAVDRNARVRLRVVATGPASVRRRLEAILVRAPLPTWPAAVVLRGGANFLTSDFRVDGRDYDMSDACETAAAGTQRFGLALPAGSPHPHADAGQITGRDGDPSILEVDGPALDGLATAAGAAHRPRGVLTGNAGTTVTPALVVVDGDARVEDAFSGAGVLFVDGRLEVAGRVDFIGVLAARAGITIVEGGTLRTCGGVWAASEPALSVRGSGRVRGSDEALAIAARVAPLPAGVRVAAVRELF